jgi:eukaryotic-like serine/threonine-protein kinase
MAENRYRILERIASGGMAEVFRGVQEGLQGFRKHVAIKRVLPALTKNKKFISMFLDEARLSLGLQHANIAQVFDIGHVDDTYFIVMEFVDGVDLKAILEWRRRINKPLTIGQTIYIVMEICKGLNYAHDLTNFETGETLGIVHRDVSPPNVLISKNGEIKVVDFGLAKATLQIEHTDPGVVKGKMSYLSPEAARGEEVDKRADIFAVGILLYEMLTNRRLFYGDTDYQTVELVRAARIPPVGPQNREVEPELEDIVRKSLTRRLEDRFQSATDMQDALAHYLFSRGLKMIQRDIAELVRKCADDVLTVSGVTRQKQVSVVDTMLQEEIRAFTSMDFDEDAAAAAAEGGRPSGDFIDPRSWADDDDGRRPSGRRSMSGPAVGGAPTGQPAASAPVVARPAPAAEPIPDQIHLSPVPLPSAQPAQPVAASASSPAGVAPAQASSKAKGIVIAVVLTVLVGAGVVVTLLMRGAGR